MAWVAALPAIAQVAGQALGNQSQSAGGSGSFIPSAPTGANPYNNRNQITIAPVGINLGQVIQPYIEGSETNGGSGLSYDSAISNMHAPSRSAHVLNTPPQTDTEILPYVVGGVAFVVLLVVALKARKRG